MFAFCEWRISLRKTRRCWVLWGFASSWRWEERFLCPGPVRLGLGANDVSPLQRQRPPACPIGE